MTEKITFDEPLSKFTGSVAICRIAVVASCIVVSREIRFDPSRLSFVTTCSSSSAQLVSMTPSATQEHERQDEREFDEALSGRRSRATTQDVESRAHLNRPSFFIDDATWIWNWPLVKNGRISGVMKSHV